MVFNKAQWSHCPLSRKVGNLKMSQELMSGGNYRGMDLKGLIAPGKELIDCDFSNSDLSGADLSKSDLRGSSFQNARLRAVNLSGAYLNRCDLSNGDFSDADLSDANLTGSIRFGAIFTNAKLKGSRDHNASVVGEKWHPDA